MLDTEFVCQYLFWPEEGQDSDAQRDAVEPQAARFPDAEAEDESN
ncbi:hypothetical protein [Paenibacillus cremeus]|nr:hypothetical protein [Paenibacillus cremeus]